MSNTKSSNQTAVPEAKGALDRFKFEVANELGVPLTDGYNGNLTSKQNGSVGGYMVKKIVSEQPLNFNSIFYIIPRVIVNYRTTFPGICYCLRTSYPETYNPRNNCIIAFILGWSYDRILRHFRNRNLVFAVPE